MVFMNILVVHEVETINWKYILFAKISWFTSYWFY